MKRLLLSLLVVGCSSTKKAYQPEFFASSVIERIGGGEETPKWTIGDIPLVEEGGNLLYSYTISMGGGSRTDSCVNAAELKAKSQIVQYIKTAITESGQLAENASQTDSGYEGITAFVASGKLSGVKLVARYWEKIQEPDTFGNKTLKLRCAARVSITKAELTKQLEDQVAKAKVNAEIKAKLLLAQEKFLDNVATENDE
jgi:hypothetical protein